jgi:hypothetical protein
MYIVTFMDSLSGFELSSDEDEPSLQPEYPDDISILTILHGNAGEMGKYAVLSVLPDKIARFLYEYHDTSYTSFKLALPAIPLDRSNVSVHGILGPDQVLRI